jgi:hypothetical protein
MPLTGASSSTLMNLISQHIRKYSDIALCQAQGRPMVSGIIAITHAAQFALRSIGRLQRTTSTEPFYQPSEFHQVRHPENCSPLAQNELWILGGNVRPLWGDCATGLVIDSQQKTHAMAVVPSTQAEEFLSAKGMEGMSHLHKVRRYERKICIPDRVTSVWKRAPSSCRRSTPPSRRWNCGPASWP